MLELAVGLLQLQQPRQQQLLPFELALLLLLVLGFAGGCQAAAALLVRSVLVAVAAVFDESGPGAFAAAEADGTASAAEPLPLCSFDEYVVDQRACAQSFAKLLCLGWSTVKQQQHSNSRHVTEHKEGVVDCRTRFIAINTHLNTLFVAGITLTSLCKCDSVLT